MYDNISDFTRYDDDHDPEHGEEEVLQTSIKTGKVLTQSLIIDTKDGEVDVLQELKKNTSSGGGGRHELEINEIEEKLAEKADKEHKHNISDINELQATLNSKADKNELDAMNKVLKSHKHNISDINELQATLNSKADKNHVHYISSDEQIITDYHGYLTQGEKVNTKNVNERRYKFIRAKGYDIHCTVQYDTGIAPQSFGYNAEIYASYFFVNGVLVEPRFMLRVKAKITFEDAIKSKADKVELEAMNKVLKSHKHNISDINELQATLDSKADKNHTHKSFTTVRADDIILNFDLGSSAPLENPSTSVKDTLNSLNSKCMNIEDHARNFEAHELPTMLDKKADKTELQTLKTEILQTLYPTGSIYTSMNSTNPATVLGFGTWEHIVDKFLYCANSSKQTGGSKKIKEANLPPHTHTGTTNFSGDHSHSLRDHPLYNSEYKAGNDVLSPSYNNSAKKTFRPTEPGGNHVHTFTTNPTGSGADYMPPFMTVFAWYRVQ
ncbi:hypothetical protein TVAG_018660 [Trichomonas vaginalis G3]|uniref:Baseplate structural protein Gp10 C-terminal domain-containing protein n=1 Tax=Trichomonas vaginalis (strain ATCC PRA-98 / G3) TaxID=412133 RepID=A2GHA8_TRIV3|nr:hypothetical protein TVAG_018660 [Trichomonas vaginalis G3]|eukprot:XP_001296387.1 hypothetical protein [Trichomonas vaginalis G3]